MYLFCPKSRLFFPIQQIKPLNKSLKSYFHNKGGGTIFKENINPREKTLIDFVLNLFYVRNYGIWSKTFVLKTSIISKPLIANWLKIGTYPLDIWSRSRSIPSGRRSTPTPAVSPWRSTAGWPAPPRGRWSAPTPAHSPRPRSRRHVDLVINHLTTCSTIQENPLNYTNMKIRQVMDV